MNINEPALVDLDARLRAGFYSSDAGFWIDLLSEIAEIKKGFQASGPSEAANQSWFLESVVQSRLEFLTCIKLVNEEKYGAAWPKLETVEIILGSLLRNPILDTTLYEIEKLMRQVRQCQSLYPYKVFFSPEFLIKIEECSICGKSMDPWSSCNHLIGKVYNGESCHRIIKEADILGISLVNDPVQKYSVAIIMNPDGSDPTDYTLVKSVLGRLRNPFDLWRAVETVRRHPHKYFPNVNEKDDCPCRSGKYFGKCCGPEDGVLKPHYQIYFDVEPEEGPFLEYFGYDKK